MVAWSEILAELNVDTTQSLWKKSGYGATKLPEVVELQKWLNANGFNAGGEDGVYGKGTANAVRAFQQKQGIAVDGDAGPGTLKAMQSAGVQKEPAQQTAPTAPAQPAQPSGDTTQGVDGPADAQANTTQPAQTTAPAPNPKDKVSPGATTTPAPAQQDAPVQQNPQDKTPKVSPQDKTAQATTGATPAGQDTTTGQQTAPVSPDAQAQTTAPGGTPTPSDTTGTTPAQQDPDGTKTATPNPKDKAPKVSPPDKTAPATTGATPAQQDPDGTKTATTKASTRDDTFNINGKQMSRNDVNKRINALLNKVNSSSVTAGINFQSMLGKLLHEALSQTELQELQTIIDAVKGNRYFARLLNSDRIKPQLVKAGVTGLPQKPEGRYSGKNKKSFRKYYKTDPKTGKEVEIDKAEADAMQAKQDKFTNTKRDADGKDDFDRMLDGDDDDDMDSAMQKSKDKIAAMKKGGADVKTTSSSTSTSTSNVTTTGGSSNTTKTSGGGSTTRFSKVMRATKETEKLRAEKKDIRKQMDALGDKSDGFEYTDSPEYKKLQAEYDSYRGTDGKVAKSKEMVHPGGVMDSNGNIKYNTKSGKWDGDQYDPKRKNDLRDDKDMTQLKRIVELAGIEDGLNFDVIDDTHVHMKNDRDFYRKQYYPAMCKIAELTKGRKVFDPKMIVMPLVDNGINSYCKKYNIAKMPDEVFKKDHRQALYDKIYSEEIEQINNGEYT
tara:strand:+ start:3284 stop:5446 length:2163 start_codon:yes stop_codon:yes gene_type:complete